MGADQHATKCINIRFDQSDSGQPTWHVSQDEMDRDGRAESSRRVLSTTDREHALWCGRMMAAREGLPVYQHVDGFRLADSPLPVPSLGANSARLDAVLSGAMG
jgi:hypothetical protein